jgi:hypothetical protein
VDLSNNTSSLPKYIFLTPLDGIEDTSYHILSDITCYLYVLLRDRSLGHLFVRNLLEAGDQ